ncbi:MAG: NAD(P)-binding protein [Myxococcaceae bacterium]
MPRKIAVLGGGASSLAAVWKLTENPGWKNDYDITVYQLGFRLGGKGATGRDETQGYRIQEHGLHLWFGFYDNAHAMLRSVLNELDRPASCPIRTWEQSMLPHNQFAMENFFNGDWHPWNLLLPNNSGTPGDGSPYPTPWELFEDALEVLYRIWSDWHPHEASKLNVLVDAVTNTLTALGQLDLDKLFGPLNTEGAHALLSFAKRVLKLRDTVAPLAGAVGDALLVRLIRAARELIWRHLENEVGVDLLAYRVWIVCDAMATIMIGVLEDKVLEKGFDHINDLNFNDWVKKHGASQLTLDSCLIQSAYDSSFAFFRRADNPDFEAGTVLRGAIRMFLMFKGSIVYRFAAGCGDTVFAPLYELLKKRGVKFEFFHEVTKLVSPSVGPMEVTEVQLAKQCEVKAGAEYQPLIDVKGLPCWPSHPLYDQLVQGAQLQSQNIDLESHWTPWAPVGQVTLKKGVDFDDVDLRAVAGAAQAGGAAADGARRQARQDGAPLEDHPHPGISAVDVARAAAARLVARLVPDVDLRRAARHLGRPHLHLADRKMAGRARPAERRLLLRRDDRGLRRDPAEGRPRLSRGAGLAGEGRRARLHLLAAVGALAQRVHRAGGGERSASRLGAAQLQVGDARRRRQRHRPGALRRPILARQHRPLGALRALGDRHHEIPGAV